VSVQIAPDAHDIGLSGSIDAALLIAPLFLAALAEWRPITLAAAGVVGSVAWVASVHVLSVGLFHATPGQWFAGLHFVTTDGGLLTWRHALRRAKPLFLIVPFMALAGAAFSLLYGAFPSQHWWIDDLIMLICVAHALVFRLVQSRRAARGVSRHTSMEICLTVKVPVVLAAPDDGPARSTSAMR
jgi:hypothetical protein